MYLCMKVDGGAVNVSVKTATNYEQVNGEYKHVPSPDDVWVKIDIGTLGFHLRMAREQLDQLRVQLAQAQQSHAEEDWHPDTVVRIAE